MTIPLLFHSLSCYILTLLFDMVLYLLSARATFNFCLFKIYAWDLSLSLDVAFNTSNARYWFYDYHFVFLLPFLWFVLSFWQTHCFEDIPDWIFYISKFRLLPKVYCGPLTPATSFGILYLEPLKSIFDIIFQWRHILLVFLPLNYFYEFYILYDLLYAKMS